MKKNIPNMLTNTAVMMALVGIGLVSAGCTHKPPAQRPAVTLPVYTQGDATAGQKQYEDNCQKCHRLQAGSNEKGPQLLRVYGAKAGSLSDYEYTQALKNSNLTWTAQNIDHYIADPKKMVAGTRMRSEPINDPKVRQDIIAYLSTLR